MENKLKINTEQLVDLYKRHGSVEEVTASQTELEQIKERINNLEKSKLDLVEMNRFVATIQNEKEYIEKEARPKFIVTKRRSDEMDEYSRILIEEYCMQTDSAKSRRLEKLVRKSYDINAEYTDSDAVFIEKAIEQEEDDILREALKDLNGFMFGW